MRIDWFQFLSALLLLLTPIGVFHGQRVRYRPLQRQWGDAHWREVLTLGLHTIDLARAALGAWLLMESLTRVPEARGILRHGVLLTHAAVLWLGVVLQTVVCKEPDSVHAPFPYVTGVTLVFFLPVIGPFALVLAIAVAMGTRVAVAFFPMLAIMLVPIGFALKGKSALLPIGVIAVMAFLPWLLSLMFSRQFVISYQSRRGSGTSSPLRTTQHRV